MHSNTPKMISRIADTLGQQDANIENLLNKSRGEIAYTIADMNSKPDADVLEEIEKNARSDSRIRIQPLILLN